MQIKAILLCSVVLSSIAFPAMAQDDGYVPPPLFGDQLRPQSDTGNLVEPRVSTITEDVAPAPVVAPAAPSSPETVIAPAPPLDKIKPIVEERKSKRVTAAPLKIEKKPEIKNAIKSAPPVPPQKPDVPASAASSVAKVAPAAVPAPLEPVAQMPAQSAPAAPMTDVTKVEPKVEPKAGPVAEVKAAAKIEAPQKADTKFRPAAKVTSEGVVTGPVSMPSVPTQRVETEQLVHVAPASGEDGITIMERHQRQMKGEQAEQKKETVEPAKKDSSKDTGAVEKTASKTPPADFEIGDAEDVMKKMLPFQPGQISLQETDVAAIGSGILEELEKRDLWRIQIRSYATSHGEGMNSDKRIALSRAIALRKALVEQGVRPSRIDVRAEGDAPLPEGKSGDRIDIYLYKPTVKTIVF